MSRRTNLLFSFALIALLAAVTPAAAQVNFEAQLFGQNEVPAIDSNAYGSCVGVLDEDETTFTLSCEHNLGTAIDAILVGAHIHTGFSDENGPVIFNLGTPASPIQAVWNLDQDEVIRLLAGGLYVNVHSQAFPAGEIRGQLRPTAPLVNQRLVFPLRGSLVVPGTGVTEDGACFAEVETTSGPFLPVQEVDVFLRCTHDLADAQNAVIRLGGFGEEGDDVLVLDDATSPIEVAFELSDEELVEAFVNGGLYLELESTAFPEGAIRGQMAGCLAGPTTLCLNDNRFQLEVDFRADLEIGEAVPIQQTDDSGLFWFFRPSNLELLVKVLDGCGVNDRYWVFLAGTTNVGFTLRVTDTLSGETETYSNTLGDIAEPILDTDAFATCP